MGNDRLLLSARRGYLNLILQVMGVLKVLKQGWDMVRFAI